MEGAVSMINAAIKPLVDKGCKIERLKLYVCPQSVIAQHQLILTAFGDLRVHPGDYVPKGKAYVIEDPGRGNGGFAWVLT